MGKYYTEEVRRIFKEFRPGDYATGFVWDIVEYEDRLGLVLYRDNFKTLDVYVQEKIANEFVPALMVKIWATSTPIYVEVRNGTGQ